MLKSYWAPRSLIARIICYQHCCFSPGPAGAVLVTPSHLKTDVASTTGVVITSAGIPRVSLLFHYYLLVIQKFLQTFFFLSVSVKRERSFHRGLASTFSPQVRVPLSTLCLKRKPPYLAIRAQFQQLVQVWGNIPIFFIFTTPQKICGLTSGPKRVAWLIFFFLSVLCLLCYVFVLFFSIRWANFGSRLTVGCRAGSEPTVSTQQLHLRPGQERAQSGTFSYSPYLD